MWPTLWIAHLITTVFIKIIMYKTYWNILKSIIQLVKHQKKTLLPRCILLDSNTKIPKWYLRLNMSFSLTLIHGVFFFFFSYKMAQINLDSRHGVMSLITSAPVKITQLQRQKYHDFQRKTLVAQRLGIVLIVIHWLLKPI